ncbi:DUF5995 family protein [Gordonia sp. LSe1-13]|uniref:DUF5995 family protein n=1 Tax=Gordonia sesuvii TaxID=3116777 RepID=A0ABU7MJG7_9ACTN|nr:DUF5995 family protein [Gordonia sp. LSe1-13]
MRPLKIFGVIVVLVALAFAPVAVPRADAAPRSVSACIPVATPAERAALADLTDPSDIKTYQDAADKISELRAALSKPNDYRGTFPIAFDEILKLVGPSIKSGIYDDPVWATNLAIEVVRLYVSALHDFVTGARPPAHWWQALRLTEQCDRSPGRVLMGQIFAHLIIDFPNALVTVKSEPRHTRDFYTFGGALVDATPAIIAAFKRTYGVDLEPLFTAWFLGDIIGDQRATTVLFQSTRTAAWVNNFGLQNPALHDATVAEMWVLYENATIFMNILEDLDQI